MADRCLYGVDVNPMAVEMAKLSLWLITLQEDRPFTFVDHCLKCGDSLLGVTNVQQVEDFTLRGAVVSSLARASARSWATRRRAALAPGAPLGALRSRSSRRPRCTAEPPLRQAPCGRLPRPSELRAPEGKAYEAERGTEGVRASATSSQAMQRRYNARPRPC